jgi:2-aminoadipate transaminase
LQNFVQPGAADTVVAEEYSYSGTLTAFRRFGVKVVGVDVDDQGMNMDDLEAKMAQQAAMGVTPKFIYCIASNQNPTGTMMPEERRHKLVEIARKYNVPVLDDDCYADLIFEGTAPPSLYSLDPENVVYIGSFSKVLGPGTRLGYFTAKPETLESCLTWKIDGGNSNLAAAIAAEYFKDHLWDHIDEVNGIVKEKLDLIEQHLDANKDVFPYHSHPKGGLFIWVKLPEDVDTTKLPDAALAQNVRYGTGKAFHSGNGDIQWLRLAYGYASLDDIRQGVPALANAVRQLQGIAVAPGR